MKKQRWIWLTKLLLGICLITPAIAQPNSEKYADLPSGRSDSALSGSTAAEVFLRATEYTTRAVSDCRKPTLRYSTVPLLASLIRQTEGNAPQEIEIWYLECPAVVPVVVRYRRQADGQIGEIHVGPFSEFVAQIKYKPLSLRRNPAFDFDAYFAKRPVYEGVCFGRVGSAMGKLLSERIARLKEPPKNYGIKALCIRTLICNSIEPDIDILHDTIIAGAGPDKDGLARANELARICGRMQEDVELLFSEEPETAYAMNAMLSLVPSYADHFYKPDR